MTRSTQHLKRKVLPSTGKGQKRSGPRRQAALRTWQNPAIILSLFVVVLGYYIFVKNAKVSYPGPFKIVDVSGRGKALVAIRDILQGEMIIRETPLLEMSVRSTSGNPEDVVHDLVQALPASNRSEFLQLSYHPPDATSHRVPFSIVQINAVSTGPGRLGVFQYQARINHGCSFAFNSIYSWREDEGVLTVHALRNISKGEEVVTAYTDTKRPRQPRRQYLEDHYHFHCACAACARSDDLVSASDNRLLIMSSFYDRIKAWQTGDIDGKEATSLAINIWELGEEEGYRSERGQLAADMAWVAAAHSDSQATRKWARVSARWFRYELGVDSEAVRTMMQVVARPESHPQWSTRAPMAVDVPPSSWLVQ